METLPNEGWAPPIESVPALDPGRILDVALRIWARRLRAPTIALCALSACALVVDALLVEPDWIEVRRSIEYVPALGPNAADLTVVHLSDPHVARIGKRERSAVALINAARPDLILISGDLTLRGARAADLEAFLSALRSRYGNFAVFGNHDYWDRAATTWGPEAVRLSGFTLLRNSSRRVLCPAGRIVVAGVDDPVTGHDSLRQAMRGVTRRDVCILLSHSPEIAQDLGNWDIDIVLAGHTHGGQVRLPWIGALYVPPGTRDTIEGWFDVRGGARLHVSQGLGWSGFPVRFFCRPRLDVITLRGGRPPDARPSRSVIGQS